MTITDELLTRAPAPLCFRVAADVERCPDILPHYRWVRFREKRGFGSGRGEMAAWRDFGGPARYPTWWLSEMSCDAAEPAVFYRHVRGVDRGMDVKWSEGLTPKERVEQGRLGEKTFSHIERTSVPVIAALGGAAMLSEPLTPRLMLASAATLTAPIRERAKFGVFRM